MNKQNYDALLNRISKIRTDSNATKAVRTALNASNHDADASSNSQVYTFDDDDDNVVDDEIIDPHRLPRKGRNTKQTKVMLRYWFYVDTHAYLPVSFTETQNRLVV